MKILHTSDWHLGHTLYNYDRTEEQASLLLQMERMVKEHRPDVFLLCGDVFHTAQPPAAVQTLFADALVRIHEAHPAMTIVVTAGNHDSGTKHEIFRTPWRALNVHAIGNLEKDEPDRHLIEIPGKGFVIAVPYSNERNLPEGFIQGLIDRVEKRNASGLPVILSAHTTVKGCDFTGHDHASEYTVGGIDCFELDSLGHGYDYLALGHIHHAQFVRGGAQRVRYSGSPLPVSFDENYAHSVSLVEVGAHGDLPVVQELPVENPHPLVTLPTSGVTDWEGGKDLLRRFPSDIPAYLRLNVEVDNFLPLEANAEAVSLVADKQCRFCYINARRAVSHDKQEKVLTVAEFQSEAPIDIARRYAEDVGISFDAEMTALFREAEGEVGKNG